MVLSKKMFIYTSLLCVSLHAADKDGWITVGPKKRKKTTSFLVHSAPLSTDSHPNTLSADHKIKQIKIDGIDTHHGYEVISKISQIQIPSKKIINKAIPLHNAVLHDDIQEIEALINKGEDICALDQKNNTTALHWAARYGKTEAAKTILAYDEGVACLGMQDNEGKTPLHRAAGIKSDVILTLVKHAPRGFIDIPDNDGSTALLWASSGGKLPAVKALLQKGADPNAQDDVRGRTALHWALRMRKGSIAKDGEQMPVKTSRAIIKNLMEYNANPYIPDAEGFSPIYWAQQLNLKLELSMLTNEKEAPRRSERNKHKR